MNMMHLNDLSGVLSSSSIVALQNANQIAERYGMALQEAQITALVEARNQSLINNGRIEFGCTLLPRLIVAFCDSPYITQYDFFDTLAALQDLFYTFKNELNDTLTDDELILALQRVYNEKAGGYMEYLENLTVSEIYRAADPDNDLRDMEDYEY